MNLLVVKITTQTQATIIIIMTKLAINHCLVYTIKVSLPYLSSDFLAFLIHFLFFLAFIHTQSISWVIHLYLQVAFGTPV